MNSKTTLFLDLPSDFNDRYLLQQKVFEYVDKRPTKYLKDYKIVYIQNKNSSNHIEKLIRDWDLDGHGYNIDKLYGQELYKSVTKIGSKADEALIFRNNTSEIGSKIVISACDNIHGLYLNTYRLDFNTFAR